MDAKDFQAGWKKGDLSYWEGRITPSLVITIVSFGTGGAAAKGGEAAGIAARTEEAAGVAARAGKVESGAAKAGKATEAASEAPKAGAPTASSGAPKASEGAAGASGAPKVEGASLALRYKTGWSEQQIAAADAKVSGLSQAGARGELSVTRVERSGTSAASMWRNAGRSVPNGADIDHMVDLQLSGPDVLQNMKPLDLSINRSLGAQIACQIRGLPVGTPIIAVSIC